MTDPFEESQYDIDIKMDSHRNTISDLSRLYEMLYDVVVDSVLDEGWSVWGGAEPCARMSVVDVSEAQIKEIRKRLADIEWDGPMPVVPFVGRRDGS